MSCWLRASLGRGGTACRGLATRARPARLLTDNTSPPRWESGQLKVLKPQFRLHARKLRFAVDAAESLGYVVLRDMAAKVERPYPPPFKSAKKEAARLAVRKARIAKGLEGMAKRRDAMHKKDRDDKYAAKMKGIHRYFPERRDAPLAKGNTRYKKLRALGNA